MKNHDPQTFLQTRSTSCGVACLMMALHTLGSPVTLTKGTEGKLFRLLRLREYDLVPAICLADYAAKQGYRVNAVLEDGPVNFWDYWRITDPVVYEAQERAYAHARAAGVNIKRHTKVNGSALRQSLASGSVAIVGVTLLEGVKHALLVYGSEEGSFEVVDPLNGRHKIPEEVLLQKMSMEFGRWYIEIRRP